MNRPLAYGLVAVAAVAAYFITREAVRRMKSPFKYFTWSEFDSPDAPGSGERFMSRELVQKLDAIRAEVGFPMRITSGYRTAAHNAKVGGVPNSAHTKGLAVDIRATSDAQKRAIASAAIRQGISRIGWGSNFIHLDIDRTKPQNVAWGYTGSQAPPYSSLA